MQVVYLMRPAVERRIATDAALVDGAAVTAAAAAHLQHLRHLVYATLDGAAQYTQYR